MIDYKKKYLKYKKKYLKLKEERVIRVKGGSAILRKLTSFLQKSPSGDSDEDDEGDVDGDGWMDLGRRELSPADRKSAEVITGSPLFGTIRELRDLISIQENEYSVSNTSAINANIDFTIDRIENIKKEIKLAEESINLTQEHLGNLKGSIYKVIESLKKSEAQKAIYDKITNSTVVTPQEKTDLDIMIKNKKEELEEIQKIIETLNKEEKEKNEFLEEQKQLLKEEQELLVKKKQILTTYEKQKIEL